MTTFSGGCICRAIRYECDAEPIMMFKCHCRDCQHVSGSAYAPVLLFPRKDVRIVKRSIQQYATQSMAGGENVRGFCANCGSRISRGQVSPRSCDSEVRTLPDALKAFRRTVTFAIASVTADRRARAVCELLLDGSNLEGYSGFGA